MSTFNQLNWLRMNRHARSSSSFGRPSCRGAWCHATCRPGLPRSIVVRGKPRSVLIDHPNFPRLVQEERSCRLEQGTGTSSYPLLSGARRRFDLRRVITELISRAEPQSAFELRIFLRAALTQHLVERTFETAFCCAVVSPPIAELDGPYVIRIDSADNQFHAVIDVVVTGAMQRD